MPLTYLVLAEEGAEDVVAHPEWLDRFELEHDNFRMALDYLIKTGDADWGLRLGSRPVSLLGNAGVSHGRAGTRSPDCWLWKEPRRVQNCALACSFAAAVLAGEQGDYDSAPTTVRREPGDLSRAKR